jgi:hypothetical protein
VPDLGLFVPLPRADILALASHAVRSTQSGANLLPRISLREPMKKIVIVETVNPVVEATPNRRCEVLKIYFHNGEEWYKLRDISSGTVFDSPEIFWVQQ